MANSFKLKLIAPDGVKYEEEANEAILPTENGQIAILPNHMPLIALLKPGEIIIKNGKDEHHLATEGGIVEVCNNLVKILVDTAESVHNLDELKIAEAKKNAEERIKNAKNDTEFADAAAALEKQIAKLRFISKRKRKY